MPRAIKTKKAENTNNGHPIAKTTFHENINYARKTRDSSVSAANRYGLDGPGIESQWGSDIFLTRPDRSGAHSASYTMGTGSFSRVKRPGRGVDYPSPQASRLKQE